MIVGYAIPAVQKFQGAAYKSLYYQALENSKADGATPDDNPCLIARGDELYRAGGGAVPSVLIVPQFVKPGAVYTQIPTPTVEAGDFDQFTFTRATTATRVNASGLIESVASGLLRLDYPIGGGCPAALIEPSAQNLAWHSQTWAAATNWFLTNTTTATGTTGTLDPLGTNTANALSPTAVSGSHFVASNISTTVSYTSGTIYTQSAFFKQGTGSAGRYVQLTLPAVIFTQLGYANFDLQLGTVTVVSGTSADTNRAASIENYGNGWYRCRFTATCNTTNTGVGVIPVLITASGDVRVPLFTGVTGDVLYGWGAQLETGAIPTSYIPTTTASATRNADVCSVSGVSGYIGQTEGTLYAEVDVRNLGYNGALITLQTDNWITNSIRIEKSVGNQWRIAIRVASVSILNVDIGTITAGIYKFALGYNTSASGTVLAVNGSILTTQTASSIPACSSVVLGSRNETGTFGIHLNDRLRAAAIYTTRLTNDQLANLTRLT